MCGVVGFWDQGRRGADLATVIAHATRTLRHRGPDDEGIWYDAELGIALGHRRLAIQDPSPDGRQPMLSGDGRYVLSFNGEVYNFLEIRRELEGRGVRFRGGSDTEVMLTSCQAWGVTGAVGRFAGMFAFALFDRAERRLHLVRDRIGEKPLYYGWSGGTLLFGSELKSLRCHPGWRGNVDRGALTLYLRHNYVPAPFSIFEGVFKAPPGAILTFSAEAPGAAPAVTTYWSADDIAEAGVAGRFPAGDAEMLLEALDGLLRRTVRRELRSDVPLGALLSGGVDSSLVVALMQAESRGPVRTFTIGFHDHGLNEAEHAARVATHLGTDHTELYVSPARARSVVPTLPALYDEPFADSSQIPTALVCRLARDKVKVCLTGDGGDELFGGYPRYEVGRRIWRSLRPVPVAMRRAAARALGALSPDKWDAILRRFPPGSLGPHRVTGERLHKLARVLPVASPRDLYRDMVSYWPRPETVVLGGEDPGHRFSDGRFSPEGDSFLAWMMYMDLVTYLPDDILVKVDRASMAVGLELRAPFVDHEVVEFAWRVPLDLKLRAGRGKWLSRRLLDRYVPRELVERPKMGFGVPLSRWLRGPLREWAGDLLAPDRLRNQGFFDPEVITRRWLDHQAGEADGQHALWGVLMFQAWLEAA